MKAAASLLVELGVTSRTQFDDLKRSKKRPETIPAHPDKYYNNYPGWRAFINLGIPDNKLVTYDKLKKFNTLNGITTKHAYKVAYKEGRLPETSPPNPETCFKAEWTDWASFLSPQSRFVSFEEARKFARTLGLKSSYEWRQYCRSGIKPTYIPTLPDRDYADFINWQDFLIGE